MPTLIPSTPLLEQEPHAVRGRDVAGHQLHVPESLPERLDRARHHRRMPVRDVDDDDVDLGAEEFGGALEIVALRADRRADAQPAVRVAGGKRKLPLRDEILGGDQSAQRAVGIEQRKLLDLVRPHRLFCLRVSGSPVCAISRSRGVIRDATVPDWSDEPQVARRQQALHPALGVDDDQRADAGVAHPGRRLGKAGVWRDRVRVADDAVLLALDDLDFADLRIDLAAAEPAVDDADPAFFRDGNRHVGARDGIHVGRDDRPLQGEMPREARRQVDGRRGRGARRRCTAG